MFCKYCKANDHVIKTCPKIAAKEAKKKVTGMAVTEASPSTTESTNVVQDTEWAFSAQCSYDPLLHDSGISVVDFDVWYFDSGDTKHITSHCSLFTSLEFSPKGNTILCASYPIEGVGQIVLNAANGSTFALYDALYVPRIKKNLLSISALSKIGLVVKFVDDKCTIHDLSYGDIIVASGTLCRGLYKLTMYGKCVEDSACVVMDLQAILDAKTLACTFWASEFCKFVAPVQKSEMVSSLPKLEALVKHVCEGCILHKM